jgi:hypothetical protein
MLSAMESSKPGWPSLDMRPSDRLKDHATKGETKMAAAARELRPTEYQGDESSVDENRVLFTGGNVEMRLSEADDDSNSTVVSLWRVIYSPNGPGETLFIRSELTDRRWRIYSNNPPLARLIQKTVQGMLVPDLADTSIPVEGARFRQNGDTRDSFTEEAEAPDARIIMTWSDFGEPILVHSHPNRPPILRPHGVCAVIFPALSGRVTINGVAAKGRAWARKRMGKPYSTCLVGYSESWTAPR